MNFSFNFLLVALSIFVAVQASYVSLNLARHIPAAFALNRRLLIAGAALTLAVGVWSMHFIGMLAVITPIAINYAVLPTLISFLICVLVTGIAIYLASLRAMRSLMLAAIIMGSGIAAMHFIGMSAVHASAHMTHAPAFVLASIAIAIAASGLALWLAFAAPQKPNFWVCALILGGAISGMHYTAMAGTSIVPMADMAPLGDAISTNALAVIVSFVAFSISGIFMLTLIPGAVEESLEEVKWKPPADAPLPESSPQAQRRPDAGAPQPELSPAASLVSEDTLPIEKQGSRFHIAFSEIVSVHANAHYTYVFNGRDDLFCPLSISDIAERLPQRSFFRTHRSYIVGLAHVTIVKKVADAGVAELNSPIRRNVPVSRGRLPSLKQDLARFRSETDAASSS